MKAKLVVLAVVLGGMAHLMAGCPSKRGDDPEVQRIIDDLNKTARGQFEITDWDEQTMKVALADNFPRSTLRNATYGLTEVYGGLTNHDCTVLVYRRGVKVAEGYSREGLIEVKEFGW